MMPAPIDFSNRDNNSGVDSLFTERWSPCAFQSFDIDDAVLTRIIDAARWSPSSFNVQPWRFYTSTKETFNDYLGLLVEANQMWAKDTSVIGFLVAENNFEHNGKTNSHAHFECGTAWMAVTLQARMEGLYSHAMGGIHAERATEYLGITSDSQEVVIGFSIGKLAELTPEQQQVEIPNQRKPLSDIWVQG